MTDQMHLLSFPEHLEGVHYALGRNKEVAPGERFRGSESIAYWQRVARTLERGCFDGIFFADSGGIYDRYKGRADEAIKYGVGWPKHDPMPTLPLMASVTEHLGFAFTMSIASNFPYPAMRLISTLDFLTDGRVGWNIVTGYLDSAARNLGLDRQLGHEPAEARHAHRYQAANDETDRSKWHHFIHAAKLGNLACVGAVVNHSGNGKEESCHDPMRKHLHTRTGETGTIECRETKHDQSHVRNGGETDHIFQIRLHEGNVRAINNGNGRKSQDEP